MWTLAGIYALGGLARLRHRKYPGAAIGFILAAVILYIGGVFG